MKNHFATIFKKYIKKTGVEMKSKYAPVPLHSCDLSLTTPSNYSQSHDSIPLKGRCQRFIVITFFSSKHSPARNKHA
jgi:hypothetical protein